MPSDNDFNCGFNQSKEEQFGLIKKDIVTSNVIFFSIEAVLFIVLIISWFDTSDESYIVFYGTLFASFIFDYIFTKKLMKRREQRFKELFVSDELSKRMTLHFYEHDFNQMNVLSGLGGFPNKAGGLGLYKGGFFCNDYFYGEYKERTCRMLDCTLGSGNYKIHNEIYVIDLKRSLTGKSFITQSRSLVQLYPGEKAKDLDNTPAMQNKYYKKNYMVTYCKDKNFANDELKKIMSQVHRWELEHMKSKSTLSTELDSSDDSSTPSYEEMDENSLDVLKSDTFEGKELFTANMAQSILKLHGDKKIQRADCFVHGDKLFCMVSRNYDMFEPKFSDGFGDLEKVESRIKEDVDAVMRVMDSLVDIVNSANL